MAKKLVGNAVFGQSGGPTTVINSAMCGAIQAAMKSNVIGTCLGMSNGILGVLNEELFDLGKEAPETIEAMKWSPAAAIGSCRYKVKTREDFQRIVDVLKAHDVRYFFYTGGNDSMDTAHKVAKLALEEGYEMRAMGIPKTIDNDLAETDHTPGYGSVIKYMGTALMEAGRDTEALYTTDTCSVVELMGRHAGWITAGAALAARSAQDAPHLVYVPECPKTEADIIKDVKAVLKKFKRCFIVASEGMRKPNGDLFSEIGGSFGKDAFGHKQLGGVSESLRELIENKVGVKCRSMKPGTIQRNGMHFASKTDALEAYQCGKRAVQHALRGVTGKMVTIQRVSNDPYAVTYGLADLEKVANGEKMLPRSFMNKAGNHISKRMRTYAAPLMRGEAKIVVDKNDGLPIFMRFERNHVKKQLKTWGK